MRYTPSGVPVASFGVATNKKWTDANGEQQEKAVFFRVTTWRKQAEIANQYLTKDSRVVVIGEVEEARPFTDRQGNNRASLEVTAQTIKFLDGREGNSEEATAQRVRKAVEQRVADDDGSIPF